MKNNNDVASSNNMDVVQNSPTTTFFCNLIPMQAFKLDYIS